ncbi:MAG: Bacterial shufflon protein N-terminal constant region [Burkholderiales bacterium]|nr:Bacterial shufflon protein N-terminal constant region [Burkholderiales bacterium]
MHNRNSGFGIIESMLTLALFAAVTMSIIFFTSHNAANKDAKILSAQTEAFAATYAKYLKSNYDTLVERIQAGPVTFSPQALDLQHVWPSDLSKANMYQQTPCVTVVKNSDTGEMEALMYYTGVSTHQSALAANIVRNASIWLGSKGGILLNGKIQGNSGWYINNGSVFLSGVSLCGGSLANNSLAINLDLLPEWNQNLQPVYSILRGIDNTSGQLSLPGRLKNANTAKSNIYFSQSNGIILDKTYPENPIKLGVTDTGSGSPGTASVGLTNTMSDRLTLDTLQPNLAYPAGTPCNAQEEGKTVADKEIPGVTNNILARSTLICTKSDLLCGNYFSK